jgi:hypothetical protein
MERVNEKRIEIGERIFIVEKMDAFESIAVLKELLTRTMPFDLMGLLGPLMNDSSIVGTLGSITKSDMSIDEFVDLQKRILTYCSEVLPSGKVSVINKSNRTFGVENLEKDIDSVFKLLVESVRLNYESFFIDNLRKTGILEIIKDSMPEQE